MKHPPVGTRVRTPDGRLGEVIPGPEDVKLPTVRVKMDKPNSVVEKHLYALYFPDELETLA